MISSSKNLISRPSSSYVSSTDREQKKTAETQLVKFPYVIDFKREVVLSYIMNTGYIGTYEANYKLLYNKNDK